MEYALPNAFMGMWWRLGMPYHRKPITANNDQLRASIDSWLRELWYKQPQNRREIASASEEARVIK